jgi:hypothetical protein
MTTFHHTVQAAGPDADKGAAELFTLPSFADFVTPEEALAAEAELYAGVIRELDEFEQTRAANSGPVVAVTDL